MKDEEEARSAVYLCDSRVGKPLLSAEWSRIVNLLSLSVLKLDQLNRSNTFLNIPTLNESKHYFENSLKTIPVKSSERAPYISNSHSTSTIGGFAGLIAASDEIGNIFSIDLFKNKFWICVRSGISVTCMHFSNSKQRELIVGLSDNSIHYYNIGTGELIAKLPAYHSSPVSSISVHPTQSFAITTSFSEAILWDTVTWKRSRVLLGAESIGLRQVSFSNTGKYAISSFWDGSVYIWDSDFEDNWKIVINPHNSEEYLPEKNNWFTVSYNDELLVHIGG
ncbi:TBC1 domain member 31 [Nowakowskiella sp. JEL0078]|nr:TBC1 domain member 31 [Nowakowskiella sp. JEL0078]